MHRFALTCGSVRSHVTTDYQHLAMCTPPSPVAHQLMSVRFITLQAQTLSSERDTAHAEAARLAEELASVRRERVSLFGEVARLRGDVLLRRAEADSAIGAQISLQREVGTLVKQC